MGGGEENEGDLAGRGRGRKGMKKRFKNVRGEAERERQGLG